MTVFIIEYLPSVLASVKKWDIEIIYHEGREYHWSYGNVRFENFSGEILSATILGRCCKFDYLGPAPHNKQ